MHHFQNLVRNLTISFMNLTDTTTLDKEELKQSLLTHGHVMVQGSITLLPRGPPNSGYFNVFYILDCAPVLQGILTKDSTVIVIHDNSNNHNNNQQHESSLARELYQKWVSFNDSKVDLYRLSKFKYFL